MPAPKDFVKLLKQHGTDSAREAMMQLDLSMSTAVAMLDDEKVYGRLWESRTNSEAVLYLLKTVIDKETTKASPSVRAALKDVRELFESTVRAQTQVFKDKQ